MVQLAYNLLGYMPAPYLYGLVVQLTETPDYQSRYGMVLTFWIQIPACFFVTYSYYCKVAADQTCGQEEKQALIEGHSLRGALEQADIRSSFDNVSLQGGV